MRRPGQPEARAPSDSLKRAGRRDSAAECTPAQASSSSEKMTDRRRELPSVDRLLHQPAIQELLGIAPRGAVVAAVRESIEAARTRRAGPPDRWEEDVRERLVRRAGSSLLPGAQRNRCRAAHQPGPCTPCDSGNSGDDGSGQRVQQPRARSSIRHSRKPERPLSRPAPLEHRRRRRTGGQQCGWRAGARAECPG